MIITELFVNALDHGVLGLDSKMKETPEGFSQYFIEREKRLSNLDYGLVRLNLTAVQLLNSGRITVAIEDSGDGFDYETAKDIISDPKIPSGRGIKLIAELCDSLSYSGTGNRAEAVYSWGPHKNQ